MNSRIANTLLIAAFAVAPVAANAQYGSPNSTTAPSTAKGDASKRLSDSDIRTYRERRGACNKMEGAAREDCRKQLSSKYVDKQCGNLTGEKLDECLKAEYPGD